jgi:hypothetical protein
VQLLDAENQVEAVMVTSLLHSAGIDSRVVQETIGTLMGLTSGYLGIIHIEVLASQHELAQQLLAAKPEPESPEQPDPPEELEQPKQPEQPTNHEN